MTAKNFFPFYDQYQRENMAVKTRGRRCGCVQKYLLPHYGSEELGDITPADINRIYDEMEMIFLAQNTVYGCRESLINFFQIAEDRGHIESGSNPARRARIIRRAW